jgi:hypothetical protein
MAAVEYLPLAVIAILGVGAIYTMKKIKDEIQDQQNIVGSNSFGSFSLPIGDTPIADARDVDIPEASYSPSLFFRGSVDEPTASEIPHAVSSRGGKTKRKRRSRKRSRRKK